jgi:NADPH:quinone reductase-like Zn-dependent oxidoreductase
MKAWQAEQPWGFENFKLVELAEPKPGPGEVLVRMKAASLNYRDLMGVLGMYGRQLPIPYIPFSDGCGVVEAVGEGVTRVAKGDRVSTLFFQNWISGPAKPEARASALGPPIPGAGRELATFNENGVSRVPDFLTDNQVATLPCAALTAWRSLFEDPHPALKPGDWVVLQGTGGVSIFGLQFAKAAGFRTIITSSSDDKLARCKAMGADHTINYKTTPDWGRAVSELTGGHGADFIMEVGGGGTLEQSLRCITVQGHIAVIGVVAGRGAMENLAGHLITTGAKLCGVFVGSRDMYEAMCRAIEQHRIEPVVDKVFPWTEAPAALRAMQNGEHFGKIVLEF